MDKLNSSLKIGWTWRLSSGDGELEPELGSSPLFCSWEQGEIWVENQESIDQSPPYQTRITRETMARGWVVERKLRAKTHSVLESVQVIHPIQLGPNFFHGHLKPRVAVYRIMNGQDVDMSMNPNGPGAHYRTE